MSKVDYRDIRGNEIRIGDTLLYYTVSGSWATGKEGKVVAFDDKQEKVHLLREGSKRVSRITRWRAAVVVNEIDRELHEKNPGLQKLWERYKTFKAIET